MHDSIRNVGVPAVFNSELLSMKENIQSVALAIEPTWQELPYRDRSKLQVGQIWQRFRNYPRNTWHTGPRILNIFVVPP